MRILNRLKHAFLFGAKKRSKSYIETQAARCGLSPEDMVEVYVRIGSAVVERAGDDTEIYFSDSEDVILVKDWIY